MTATPTRSFSGAAKGKDDMSKRSELAFLRTQMLTFQDRRDDDKMDRCEMASYKLMRAFFHKHYPPLIRDGSGSRTDGSKTLRHKDADLRQLATGKQIAHVFRFVLQMISNVRVNKV